MGDKTKKEHYVPRCYLENWKNNKGQVWVYDRRLKKTRINNVYDYRNNWLLKRSETFKKKSEKYDDMHKKTQDKIFE